MNVDIEELEIDDYDILENIKTALYRLWKYKLVVFLVTLIGCLCALVYIGIVGIQNYYRTTATVYSVAYGSYEDSTNGVVIMNTYAGLLGSPSVCERAAATLQDTGISAMALKSMVSSGQIYLSGASTNSKSYGYRLTLVVAQNAPEYVIPIANAMAQAFVDEINDLLGTNTLQVVDNANRYSMSKSINVPLCILIFGGVAMVLSCGIIFMLEFFSVRVYSIAQCERKKEMILGLIPYNK